MLTSFKSHLLYFYCTQCGTYRIYKLYVRDICLNDLIDVEIINICGGGIFLSCKGKVIRESKNRSLCST